MRTNKHLGPGPHPDGTPQSVHSGGADPNFKARGEKCAAGCRPAADIVQAQNKKELHRLWTGKALDLAVEIASKAIDQAKVVVNVPARSIFGVLKEGRYHSRSSNPEAYVSGGAPEDRTEWENSLSGGIAQAGDYPTYGTLEYAGETGSEAYVDNRRGYGRWKFVLKDTVKKRTTFTPDDSGPFTAEAFIPLDHPDRGFAIFGTPSGLRKGDITKQQLREEINHTIAHQVAFDPGFGGTTIAYTETQIWGGWNMDDVDEVCLDADDSVNDQTSEDARVIETIRNKYPRVRITAYADKQKTILYEPASKHLGPGPHPDGTPQSIHAGGQQRGVAAAAGCGRYAAPRLEQYKAECAKEYTPEAWAKIQQGGQAAAAAIDQAKVVVCVPGRAIAALVKEGVSHTSSANPIKYMSSGKKTDRFEWEKTLADGAAEREDAPVYGSLEYAGATGEENYFNSRANYGRWGFTLNDSVKKRTTFTSNDSGPFEAAAFVPLDHPDRGLVLFGDVEFAPTPQKYAEKAAADAIHAHNSNGRYPFDPDMSLRGWKSYTETQIWGGWNMDEVDEVCLSETSGYRVDSMEDEEVSVGALIRAHQLDQEETTALYEMRNKYPHIQVSFRRRNGEKIALFEPTAKDMSAQTLRKHGPGNQSAHGHRGLQAHLSSLKENLAAAAQQVLDDWQPDEDGYDEGLGGGGACDEIAAAMAGVLSSEGIEVQDGGQDGDDHAWLIALDHARREAFGVDIPPDVYESGGGFAWKKHAGAAVTPEDVQIFRLKYSDVNGDEMRTNKSGTPEGAKAGWETRRRGGAGQSGAKHWIIRKRSRDAMTSYEGPTCDHAGVKPGKVYGSKRAADAAAAKLDAHNPVGFESVGLTHPKHIRAALEAEAQVNDIAHPRHWDVGADGSISANGRHQGQKFSAHVSDKGVTNDHEANLTIGGQTHRTVVNSHAEGRAWVSRKLKQRAAKQFGPMLESETSMREQAWRTLTAAELEQSTADVTDTHFQYPPAVHNFTPPAVTGRVTKMRAAVYAAVEKAGTSAGARRGWTKRHADTFMRFSETQGIPSRTGFKGGTKAWNDTVRDARNGLGLHDPGSGKTYTPNHILDTHRRMFGDVDEATTHQVVSMRQRIRPLGRR